MSKEALVHPSTHPLHWQPAGPEVTCECVLWHLRDPRVTPGAMSYTHSPKEARQWDLVKDIRKSLVLALTKSQYSFFTLGFTGGSCNSYLWKLQDAKKISHADCRGDPTRVRPDHSVINCTLFSTRPREQMSSSKVH